VIVMPANRRRPRHVAIVAYPGCSLLELVAAQSAWATAASMSTLRSVVVAGTRDFMASTTPLAFQAQRTFEEVPQPDVLIVIGGGEASQDAAGDPALLRYVRTSANRASVVLSTGTGSLVLAAAGLLDGREATTHWAFRKHLEALGVTYRRAGWVEDGKIITGAGASAAIDVSLLAISRLRGERLARVAQTMLEWDPQPPHGRIDWARADETFVTAEDDAAVPRSVAHVIYEGLTVLDLVGPLEVMTELSRYRPDFVPVVVAEDERPVRSDDGLTFRPNATFQSLPSPDVVIVPGGGVPTLRAMGNPAIRRYLRTAATDADRTVSVCTGALLLASVGVLDGLRATTHWAYRGYLPAFGATYVQQRWVRNGSVINSAGVSAGIDMALSLTAELAGDVVARRVQLGLHYDPDPPFGGIDYEHLPRSLRALRAVLDLSVPLFTRRPRRLTRTGR
jgi:transcriptional regulator GlxA family with amidase domain